MASAATLAKYNNDMKRFEYNINKIIDGIDRRKKSKEADEDIMEKHLVATGTDGTRTWSFS